MRDEILANCCRVCLGRSRKLRSLYTPAEEGEVSPSEMLQLIAGIHLEKIEENPRLPKKLCRNCELALTMAYEFRIKAIKNHRLITLFLKDSNARQTKEDGERQLLLMMEQQNNCQLLVTQNNVEQNALENDLLDVHQIIDVDVMEGEETVRENASLQDIYGGEVSHELTVSCGGNAAVDEITDSRSQDCEGLVSTDSMEQLAEVYVTDIMVEGEDGNISEAEIYELKANLLGDDVAAIVLEHDTEEVEVTDNQIIEEEILMESKSETTVKVDEEVKGNKQELVITTYDTTAAPTVLKANEEEDSQPKTAITSTEPAIKKRRTKAMLTVTGVSKIPTDNKRKGGLFKSKTSNHICDICGNVYDKRSRMVEHRQRHQRELKYSCELCDMKFHMRELLRKHMFLHSGGKPHKCAYCSRTFYYESVRKAHENVHKGLRPFICKVCGKTFSYAHALKKHELIHDEIKLYRCIYCKKDFRLQHHMKQHILTKMHQNAVKIAIEKGDYVHIPKMDNEHSPRKVHVEVTIDDSEATSD